MLRCSVDMEQGSLGSTTPLGVGVRVRPEKGHLGRHMHALLRCHHNITGRQCNARLGKHQYISIPLIVGGFSINFFNFLTLSNISRDYHWLTAIAKSRHGHLSTMIVNCPSPWWGQHGQGQGSPGGGRYRARLRAHHGGRMVCVAAVSTVEMLLGSRVSTASSDDRPMSLCRVALADGSDMEGAGGN